MSFVLRFVSQTATGREIVRGRTADGDILRIGRDPVSDIHLTDLEVAQHHAELRQIAPQRLLLEASAELPIHVEGRSTKHEEIDPSRGSEIRIGSHRLTISLGEEPGVIAIQVDRVDRTPVSDEEARLRRFSLIGAAPGKRRMAWLLGLIVLALFLIWPIWSFSHRSAGVPTHHGQSLADGSWSPGPLSRAHAALERNCKACHLAAFTAVPDRACTTCHQDVHDHADPARLAAALPAQGGLAGLRNAIAGVFGRAPGRCVDCHLEHQGAVARPIASGHSCTDCHAELSQRLSDARVADAADFADAHPQFRPLLTVRTEPIPEFARISLDAHPHEETGLKFPHALHLSTVGGVARMAETMGHEGPLACRDCHVPDETGTRFRPVTMMANCQQCHSLAFGRAGNTIRTLRHGDVAQVIADVRDFVLSRPAGSINTHGLRRRPGDSTTGATLPAVADPAQAVRALFSPGGACYDCHVIRGPSQPGGLDYSVVPVKLPQRYLAHGWFDHAAHSTTSCASCHAAQHSVDARDVMIPGVATCRNCHGGQAARPPLVRSSCEMCHDYHRGASAPRSVRDRRRAILPLPSSAQRD
jgi:hypothetical protein